MELFAYTIKITGSKITGVSDFEDLVAILKQIGLPGTAPPEWVLLETKVSAHDAPSVYIHDEGGPEEWSVSWVKFAPTAH